MSGASKLAQGYPQMPQSDPQNWGTEYYQARHQPAIDIMKDTGDFSYWAHPLISLGMGSAELVDKFTNDGLSSVSQGRDNWYDNSMKRAKSEFEHLLQQKQQQSNR